MSTIQNVEVVRGNTKIFQITIYTDSTQETKVDIDNYDFFLTVKSAFSDVDASALIAKDPSDFTITDDVAQVEITDDDNDIAAGEYKYDIKYKTAEGKFYTPIRGVYEVLNYVTRREA